MYRNPFSDLYSKKDKLRRENSELRSLAESTEFEDNDGRALIIAALTTILPFVVCLIVLFYIILKVLFKI